jgi:hypothetical protein
MIFPDTHTLVLIKMQAKKKNNSNKESKDFFFFLKKNIVLRCGHSLGGC